MMSAISWWEHVTLMRWCQLYHGENTLHWWDDVSYIMVRTRYIVMRWCQLYHGENTLHWWDDVSYIMVRTRYIVMRWWCLLCTRPTSTKMDFYSASSLKQHYLDSESTTLCSYSLMLHGEAANTNNTVFNVTRSWTNNLPRGLNQQSTTTH
jgi:hypothetical protein